MSQAIGGVGGAGGTSSVGGAGATGNCRCCGHPASSPLPFQQLILHQAELVKGLVVVGVDGVAGGASLREMKILRTSSNHFYGLDRQLKDSIFGAVFHCVGLQKRVLGDREVFERTVPNVEYAIKIYERHKIDHFQRLRVDRGLSVLEDPRTEIAALQLMGAHPNISRHFECCVDIHTRNVYSILEFCGGGELFDEVLSYGRLTEGRAKFIFKQLVAGLTHMESVGLAHRDFTLENVLLDQDGNAKIIDFGMCVLLPHDQKTGALLPITMQNIIGKHNYISPEVQAQEPIYHPNISDMWSLGVILFILLTGNPLCDVASPIDERYRIVLQGGLRTLIVDHGGFNLSKEALDLLDALLKPNPAERATLSQLRAHPWAL